MVVVVAREESVCLVLKRVIVEVICDHFFYGTVSPAFVWEFKVILKGASVQDI